MSTAGAATGQTPYELIRDGILNGELAPGQQLTEKNLAAWCGVSRTPIREALGRLERDGLVSWTERGTVVRERTPEEILDIYDVRITLEALAAHTAAQRRSEHDVIVLHRLAEQAGNVDSDDLEAKLRMSRTFHETVRKAAHNQSLTDLLDRLHLQLARHSDTHPTLSQEGRWEAAVATYRSLVTAIESRQPDEAEQLSKQYFTEARRIRLEALAAQL